MFFREYLWMACIAAIVAFPCTYAVMHHWLEQYAYHISIGMDLFIVWLGIVIILVFLTILQQIVQAAQQNPAEVIKSEKKRVLSHNMCAIPHGYSIRLQDLIV